MKKTMFVLLLCLMLTACAPAMAAIVITTPAPVTTPGPQSPLTLPDGLRIIDEQAFMNNTSVMGAVVIPDGVTEIRAEAFAGCANVTELHLPKSLTSIGSRAFAGTGLSGDIVLPNGTAFAADAFEGCDVQVYHELPENCFRYVLMDSGAYITGYTGSSGGDLTPGSVTDMVVPRKINGKPVTGITNGALANLTDITGRLILPDTVQYIGENAFHSSRFTGPLPWPRDLKEIGKSAYYQCSGFTGDLVIPKGVTVNPWAFAYCGNLTRLVIPQSWTEIPDYAFCGCYGLTGALQLPPNLKIIGEYAFFKTGFTGTLALPQTVESIGYAAFNQCHGLTGTLALPSSLHTIGEYAFELCDGLSGELVIPESVTSLGGAAFADCTGLTGVTLPPLDTIGYQAFARCQGLSGTLTIPEGVRRIGHGAFEECVGLTGLELPSTLTGIGPAAFSYCVNLSGTLDLPERLATIGECAFQCCVKLSGLSLPATESIGSYAFPGCTGLQGQLVIPEGVAEIGDGAFAECTGLSGLSLPSTLKTIGSGAFGSCTGLQGGLSFPEGLETVGSYAFSDCSGLSGNLTFPQSLQTIGREAFRSCAGLSGTPVIPDTVREIGLRAFAGTRLTGMYVLLEGASAKGADTDSGMEIYVEMPASYLNWTIQNGEAVILDYCGYNYDLDLVVPRRLGGAPVTCISGEGFNHCSMISGRLHLPDTLREIHSGAFSRCTGLTGPLRLPSGLEVIGRAAFLECTGLTGNLVIPDSVKSIGSSAFADLTGMTGSLQLSSGLTEIEDSAFMRSAFTGELSLPAGVTRIGEQAFFDCDSLTGSLTIPESVDVIGDQAFAHCSGFTGSLELPAEMISIGENAFTYCTGFTGSLTIPQGITAIEYGTFNLAGFTGDLVLPEGLTSIAQYAFQQTGFQGTLTLPSTLQTIGYRAFINVGFTGTLALPHGLTYIDNEAFRNCSQFTGSLIIPSTMREISGYVFRGCSSLNGKLFLPEGLERIGAGAFSLASGLKGWVDIPSTVTFIGNYAFNGCTGLRSRMEKSEDMIIEPKAFQGATANFVVVDMEGQRDMKAQAEALLLSKMEGMLTPDDLFSIKMDDGTGSLERMIQAGVAVIFGNASSVVMPQVKSEYLFKQAIAAASTNHSVTVYNKEYFGPAMALINGGNAAGGDVYLQALTENLSNDDITNTLVDLGFEDVIDLHRAGKMTDGMVETFLTEAGMSSSWISQVVEGMHHLQKFDAAAQYIKVAGSVISNFKEDLSSAINQAELLDALDKSDLAETARVFLASSDADVQLVGRQLNQIARANTYESCMALVLGGDLMKVGVDLLADKLIDLATQKWASSVSLSTAIVGGLTGVGDNYRLVNELTYSSDAARASYAVFQSDLAAYRAGHSGRAFTNAYWSYCTYAETAARSLDDFVKIYDHCGSTAIGSAYITDEMDQIVAYARNQAALMRRFADSARAMYENLWVNFDPDAFNAEVERINSTDYGKPYQ